MFIKKVKNFATEKKIFDQTRLYSYGIWLLSRRDYTIYDLSQKMKKYQPDDEIINNVINKIKNLGYLNDEKTAINIVKSKINKESAYKIKKTLLDKGIDKNIIENIISESFLEDTELNAAIHLLDKKFKQYNKDLEKKYFNFLSSKGYKFDVILKSLTQFKNIDKQ